MTDKQQNSDALLDILFDRKWYAEQYNVPESIDLVEHYRSEGVLNKYNPHPLFDTAYYLKTYRDVAASRVNPLLHFINHGGREARCPHPLFDSAWYIRRYPEVGRLGVNPLVDYLTEGAAQGREPNPSFNSARYRDKHPEAVGMNPLIHYVLVGAKTEAGEDRQRLQIHRSKGIGDVLLITPVVRALREKYPNHQITVSTLFPEIFKNNPHVDRIIEAEAPVSGFDQTLTMNYELTPDKHIVEAYADIAEVKLTDRTPELYLGHDERAHAQALLDSVGVSSEQAFCAMQITSGWLVRDWGRDRFKKVAEALERDGVSVVVLGEAAEPAIDFGIDLRGKTSLRVTAAIIEKCALMVTIDSALMHFAYALRRPVVSLFGCTDPEKRVPDWAAATALYSDMICHGCHHRQRPVPQTLAPDCPWETVRCMERLASNTVVTVARRELDKTANPVVSIVIPHYFNDLLHACIQSILLCGARRPFEIIVVADGSPEESLSSLRPWLPRIRVVSLEPNRGFSRACNAGAAAARGKYILFLNDDTTATPGWLDAMVDALEDSPEIGIVGPKLLYPETNGIQHCGTVFNEAGLGEHIYRHLPANFAAANRPRFYRALTGACLLMERKLFAELGGFDTSFHGSGGCEDTDLCFKVLASGRMVAYLPESIVYHYEGLTRGLRDETHPEDVHNRKLLGERWARYMVPDVGDYMLLAAIEAEEGRGWRWLRDVPPELVERYDTVDRRTPVRLPFKIHITADDTPISGFLRLNRAAGVPGTDIFHDPVATLTLPFVSECITELRAADVVGQFTWLDFLQFLRECYRVITRDGRLIIQTADLRALTRDYLAASASLGDEDVVGMMELQEGMPGVRLNDWVFGDPARCRHPLRRSCLDSESLVKLCTMVGFTNMTCRKIADVDGPPRIEVIAAR
jgi:GT2 family glycosyltransferase/ADP-heptose:LPS heptosyltransferase